MGKLKNIELSKLKKLIVKLDNCWENTKLIKLDSKARDKSHQYHRE